MELIYFMTQMNQDLLKIQSIACIPDAVGWPHWILTRIGLLNWDIKRDKSDVETTLDTF